MKLKESLKKPLATFFIFILGIFAVSGLSYIATVIGAAPGTNPENGKPNAFIPINTGSTAQGRCKAIDTSKPITISNFYNDCQSGNYGLDGSSRLYTNGVLVKTPNTTFQITGDLTSNYKYGALYTSCTDSSSLISDIEVRRRCGNFTPTSGQPPAYLYGDIKMIDLIDSNQTGEKQLCLDKTTGAVKICQ